MVPSTQHQAEPARSKLVRFLRHRLAPELLVVIAFCLFTAALTWPYVTQLRDAVVDPGDPYLISWILWWDYHQTFTNPLHLFDANLFYPLRYTLALSEHSYGIAVLFFPLFALGVRPLTVQAIAMFLGFALSGYGAFRLGRTLTGSTMVGWVAGIIFAFVPYRFHLMSQVAYLFSPWIPLAFEALVLFARERSRKRAAWLGLAFFMTGLTTVSWFSFLLIPFAMYLIVLATRYRLWGERRFWQRGIAALAAAVLLLTPFMLPYYLVARLYGFKRSIEEIQINSALPIHWLSAENRNKLWQGMGKGTPESFKFRLFPGLLPILFSLAVLPRGIGRKSDDLDVSRLAPSLESWMRWLDILIVVAFAVSLLAIGFDRTNAFLGLSPYLTPARVLTILIVAVLVRLCLAYPTFLPSTRSNLIETIRSPHRCDAFWLGTLLTAVGFCYSLGWNFFFYRVCYELIPIFRSMRVPSRGAMFAYLGLALLSGLGVKRLAESLTRRTRRLRPAAICVGACALMLMEFNAAPLQLMHGEVDPDGVTLKLKQTPMRGGIVVLPAGGDFNHRYVLRSADHQKPLIVGTSGFNSPIEDRIEMMTHEGALSGALMDLFESVPASYLVIENQLIVPERKPDYQAFLAGALISNRLRFINRFDGHSDLYAVVKTEPEATSEASLPIDLSIPDWSTKIREDPVNILGQVAVWSQALYRVYLASSGSPPRYEGFIGDMEKIGRGVVIGSGPQAEQFRSNLRNFLNEWSARPAFKKSLGSLDDAQYIDRLCKNAGIDINAVERADMIAALTQGQETRSAILLKVVDDSRFVEKEMYRSMVFLHYFGYLRRNPGDAPDHDLSGFDFWLQTLEQHHDVSRLAAAFKQSGEYLRIQEQH